MASKQTPAVTYASPNIPLGAIRRFARRIGKHFHPETIILFGSYPSKKMTGFCVTLLKREGAL